MSYSKLKNLQGELTPIASSNGATNPATHDVNGLMTKEDKIKLDNLSKMAVTGTIPAGETSITLTSSLITDNAIIDIYYKDKLIGATNVITEEGSITIEIPAQETETLVGVKVV